jgi:5'-deoxynucleotidase YfbR-like HD superfamily hydrolase
MSSYAGSDDDGSVVSLEDSVKAISILSDIVPVKKKHERLEQRMTKIENKLEQLRISKINNAELEREWSRCRAEIFKDVDSRSPQSRLRVEREVQKRQEFLERLCSPKRQRNKTITDGIAKTYHAEIEHQAKEKPG